MVVLDSLPLSIVEMDGFNLFVRSMDPRFTIPSRRTIGRSLDECYQMVQLYEHFKRTRPLIL